MANWDLEPVRARPARNDLRCLACGGPLESPLVKVGSLRCLDCRAANAALDPKYTKRKRGRARWTRVLFGPQLRTPLPEELNGATRPHRINSARLPTYWAHPVSIQVRKRCTCSVGQRPSQGMLPSARRP